MNWVAILAIGFAGGIVGGVLTFLGSIWILGHLKD